MITGGSSPGRWISKLPDRDHIPLLRRPEGRVVFVHTGAGQPVRVWPLRAERPSPARGKLLRARGHTVRVVCNPLNNAIWWLAAGEKMWPLPPALQRCSA